MMPAKFSNSSTPPSPLVHVWYVQRPAKRCANLTKQDAGSTEMRFNFCKSCKAGPRQGQAEKLSKSKKKFRPTMYKD